MFPPVASSPCCPSKKYCLPSLFTTFRWHFCPCCCARSKPSSDLTGLGSTFLEKLEEEQKRLAKASLSHSCTPGSIDSDFCTSEARELLVPTLTDGRTGSTAAGGQGPGVRRACRVGCGHYPNPCCSPARSCCTRTYLPLGRASCCYTHICAMCQCLQAFLDSKCAAW